MTFFTGFLIGQAVTCLSLLVVCAFFGGAR